MEGVGGGVALGVGVGVGVDVAVGVGVGVDVGVDAGVGVGVDVAVDVGVGVGVAEETVPVKLIVVHFPASRDRVTTVVSKMHGGQWFINTVIEGNSVVLPGSPGLCSELQGRIQARIYRPICRQIDKSSPPCRSKGDGVPP